MSLSKQLGLSFSFILLVTFVGTLWMNVLNTRAFIEQQLASHAQDTATSLGLSISPYIGAEGGLAIVDTMTNAIFDRGYYQHLVLTDSQGNVLIEKHNPESIDTVPNWFRNWFSLEPPSASTQIDDGWMLQGQLTVTSHPGIAYRQLWHSALRSMFVTLFAFGLAAVLVWFLVKIVITRPINSVIRQADAISQRHFEQINKIPKTRELNRFVVALNTMSMRLFQMFENLTNQSEEYRRFAYDDNLTGVGNRRAFDLHLNQLLDSQSTEQEAFLFLVRASSLKIIHTRMGGAAGDQYLLNICGAIVESTKELTEPVSLFRLNGGEFALIVEDIDSTKAEVLAEKICKLTKHLEKTEHQSGTAHIGVTQFSSSHTLKSILERADTALASAATSDTRWQIASNLNVTSSNMFWREKLEQIIQAQSAEFVAQSIQEKDGEIAYKEWFVRLPNLIESETLPIKQLIAAANRLDYTLDIDRIVFTNLVKHMAFSHDKVGININRLSLFNNAFMVWLLELLHQNKSVC